MDYIKNFGSQNIAESKKEITTSMKQFTESLRGFVKQSLTEYPLQSLKLVPSSRHPAFVNTKTMRDTYIKGPRGGHYFMNAKGQLFRVIK